MFQSTSSFETGLSDHHHRIYSIRKSRFEKEESKQVICRNCKHFQWQHFENDVKSSLDNWSGNFEVYEKAFTSALNSHVPKKLKVLRGIINLIEIKNLGKQSWKGQG